MMDGNFHQRKKMSEYIRKENAVDAVAFGITIASAFNIETGEWTKLFQRENDELREAIKRIHDLPSVDVVPVVRCENCVHWSDSNQCARPELSGTRWHDAKYFETMPDDFCSYGERKE